MIGLRVFRTQAPKDLHRRVLAHVTLVLERKTICTQPQLKLHRHLYDCVVLSLEDSRIETKVYGPNSRYTACFCLCNSQVGEPFTIHRRYMS